MIKVENKVNVYEVDGTEVSGVPNKTISVLSHWNNQHMVTIEIEGKTYTVLAKDLSAAINNACNIARF